MKIFAIGDLHLSFDERIEKPMDVFGPRWVNHYQRVREHWEAMVDSEDVVIIPGDVSWGLRQEEALADFAWIHQLPGRKVITKGNHDLWWTSVTKLNKLYDDITFLQNHCFPAGRLSDILMEFVAPNFFASVLGIALQDWQVFLLGFLPGSSTLLLHFEANPIGYDGRSVCNMYLRYVKKFLWRCG